MRDSDSNFVCEKVLQSSQVHVHIASLLTELEESPPDLIWVCLAHTANTSANTTRNHTAVRLLLQKQLSMNHHIAVEAVSTNASIPGFYIQPQWLENYEQLRIANVWWCALGLKKTSVVNSKSSCPTTVTLSSFALPNRFLSCCGSAQRKHKGIRPRRTPVAYFLLSVKMLREAYVATFDAPVSAFPTDAKERSKHAAQQAKTTSASDKPNAKRKPAGVKTWHEDDGPGEHADNLVPPKPSKQIENVFDDCGDNVASILEADEKVYSMFELEIYSMCGSTKCPDDDSVDNCLDKMFSDEYLFWSFPGSDPTPESEQIEERPFSVFCDNFVAVYHVLKQQPGKRDVMELFGGKGETTKLAVRRKLLTGANFDIVCNIDLTDPFQIEHLWHYIRATQVEVIICAPPCTSFGPWARFNRVHHFDTWNYNHKIGLLLANLTAEICLYQLTKNRHFVIENPWSSEIWSLPLFIKLANLSGHWAYLDQCEIGLVDPQQIPTRKPTAFLASCEELIWRLRKTCKGNHAHVPLAGKVCGFSRCKFAQAWPKRLVELLVDGIIETIKRARPKTDFAFPARRVAVDSYGGEAAPRCPGCTSHAASHDPRHNRVRGVCKYPDVETVIWDCPACKSHLPSKHASHLLDATCQWSHARQRQGGPHQAQAVPSRLRDPRAPPSVPVVAPDSVPDNVIPPRIGGVPWIPESNAAIIAVLEAHKDRDGWHVYLKFNAINVWTNGRALRTPAPRFPDDMFKARSIYGLFPESVHPNGQWWCLEYFVDYNEPEHNLLRTCPTGYPVPVLIHVFHGEGSAPVLKDSRQDAATSSTDVPRRRQIPSAEPAEPVENGEEPELPPAAVPPAPLGDDDAPPAVPEWSTFDLGRCLRALRSDDNAIQARALKRLHLRWYHASSDKMLKLLRAAGVPSSALALVPNDVSSCKACRAWVRTSPRSITSTRLSTRFNEVVQFDILFVEDKVIGALIDESIRWEAAECLDSRRPDDILRFIVDRWLRIYGPMGTLLSDQEGGIASEQAAIWAERNNITLRLRPKGAHATIIERHHAMVRDIIHKIGTQAELERLDIPFNDKLSEAIFAKNIFLNVGGYSPFQALYGRFPAVLSDLETSSQSVVFDDSGSIAGASRSVIRLREIALSAMVEATALSRMRLAENYNSRLSGDLLGLEVGDSVDIHRTPANKDLSGWRGPCEVLSVGKLDSGVIDVRWGGRTMSCRIQDVRKTVLFVFLLDDGEPPIALIRQHLLNIHHGLQIVSWISNESGWQLSKGALESPALYNAILHVAANELGITRCIGARIGRGFHHLGGLNQVVTCFLV